MSDIETKLANYRAQKESHFQKNGTNFGSFFSSKKQETDQERLLPNTNDDTSTLISNSDCDSDSIIENDNLNLNCCSYVEWIYYILYFSLWATIYTIFIKLQFGTVFLITSALVGIFYNTRTTPKKKDEVSAYSVFNKDCRSIDGTLKAEQFEREIRYGPGVVRS